MAFIKINLQIPVDIQTEIIDNFGLQEFFFCPKEIFYYMIWIWLLRLEAV